MIALHPLVKIARGELGVHETSRNQGPGILKYWEATSYGVDGFANREPWCAAFVAWCVFLHLGGSKYRPKSAAVRDWVPDALRLNWRVFGPRDGILFPRAGDIVVFRFSHIGIVEDFSGTHIKTIDGNTDDEGSREGREVAERTRETMLARSFIRLPEGTK
ncbi:MAG: CHAP domain-containing protein [Terrimicrobiaceae bacterium]